MSRPVVVFDGECGLCNRMVRYLVRADRYGRFRLTGSNSTAGRALIKRAGLPAGITAQSVVVVDGTQSWARSDAVIKVASQLPFPFSLLAGIRFVPRRLRDRVYNIVANHRSRLAGADPACGMPPPNLRERWMSRVVDESSIEAEPNETQFRFDFDWRFRPVLLLFGVRAKNTFVLLDSETFTARFGPFWIQTPVSNIASVQESGPYRAYRAIGTRLSRVDHGLTFGSNARKGVCIKFRENVSLNGLKHFHPGLTVTLQEPGRFVKSVTNYM